MKKIIFSHKKQISNIMLAFLWLIFGYLFLLSLIKPIYQDEGVFLTIGKGMWDGNIPYLDFWDHKPPGMYYLAALLYPLFGKEFLFYKLFLWIINIFSGILVFRISEKIDKGCGKFSIIIFLLSLIFFEGNYFIAEPFMGLLILTSVYCLLLDSGKRLNSFICGVSLFLAIMFKQTAVLSVVPIFVYFMLNRNFKKTFALLGGFILSFMVVLILIWEFDVSDLFWKQVIVSTFVHYLPDRLINVLSSWLETFLRVWWLCLGFVFFFIRKASVSKDEMLLSFLAFLPICSFFVRPYPHYWIQVLPFLAILSGAGFVKFIKYTKNSNKNLYIGFLYVLIIFSLFQNASWFKWVTQNLNFPRQTEQMEAIKYVDMLSPEYVLAENYFIGFYFLTDYQNLNKYLYLTEVNESEDARHKTLDSLKSTHSVVVLWPDDRTYVYDKEIGRFLDANAIKIKTYSSLNLAIYYKK